MAAYVIVNVNTREPGRYERYKELAQQTVAKYDGRYIVRGGELRMLEGQWNPTRIVVLEFPSMERAVEWWNSAEYAQAKALRQEISYTDLLVVQGVELP